MIKEILLLHHSHFDYGYSHPQPAVAELAVRAIDEALDLADASAALPAGERFCWSCETTASLGWWLDRASRTQKERLRAVAARGQISCGALPFHGTPLLGYDDYRLALEDAVRVREECGLPCNVAVQNDVNGIGWPAVGILREAGVELLAMGMNLTMGALTFNRRHVLFRWQGPDGREILAFHGDHYNAFGRLFRLTAPGDPLDATLWPAYEKRLREEWAWPHEWVVLTVTMNRFPDNNPPDPHLVNVVRQWNSTGGLPRVHLASLEDVAARMQSVPRDSLPVVSGDWSDYWASGVGSSARETAVNRRAKRRLAAAASLAVATRSAHRPLLSQARRAALWWDEHTWGAYHSVEGEANDTVAMQWQEKAALAWRAASLSEIVMRDELEVLAGNPATGTRPTGILLFNPAPEPAAWARRLIERLVTGEYVHSRGRAAALDAPFHTLRGTETEAAGTASWAQGAPLPPYGWRFLPISEALAGRVVEPEAGEGWMANAWLSLHFDSSSGRVLSLRRRGADEDLLANKSEFSFCQPVHETPGSRPPAPKPPLAGREAFWVLDYDRIHHNRSTWRTDWTAIRTGAEAAGCEVVRRPGSVTLVVRWRGADGLVAATHLTLHGHRPGLDIEFEIEKGEQPLPEALYLVFPLQMGAGWRAYGDTIDTPFEVDAEQLPGVCRDFLAVSSWLAVEGDQGCVQLCCPDAPLAAVGDFAFGRLQSAVERTANPLLLAWALNNYWFTNFRISQPGTIRLRYQLFFDRSYNAPACVRRALAAEQQVELHPVLRLPPPDRREGALCRVTGDLVLLRIEGGRDQAIVTVMNPLSERAEGGLALTVGNWGAPSLVDILGKPLSDAGVSLQITPDRVLLSLPGRRTIRCAFPATQPQETPFA